MQEATHYTLMLDPAGDAHHTGRIIDDSFERAITYQIAQALQKKLENDLCCTVIITRTPGEWVHPLQNANFANRLPIDLYISLACYHDAQEKHTIALYRYSRGESFIPQSSDLSMIPSTKAHWKSTSKSQKFAQTMYRTLESTYAHQFQLKPVAAIPFAPLTGIQAPAIGIEINYISAEDSTTYIASLAKSIVTALTS